MRSFRTKLFLAAVATATVALVVAGLLFAQSMRRRTDETLEQTLVAEARLATELLARDTSITVTSAISLLVGASLGEISGGNTSRFGALAAGTALLAAPSILRAQGGPLKVGVLLPRSGAQAGIGQDCHRGVELSQLSSDFAMPPAGSDGLRGGNPPLRARAPRG